jgi:hypothetical protein
MLSFKTFLTETETLKLGSFINDQGQHDVGTIVNLLKKNKVPVRNVPISRLLRKNSDTETREGNFGKMLSNPTPAFIKRTNKANTRYPILLDTKGWVIDGTHRLAKLAMKNARHARVQVVPRSILKQARIDT